MIVSNVVHQVVWAAAWQKVEVDFPAVSVKRHCTEEAVIFRFLLTRVIILLEVSDPYTARAGERKLTGKCQYPARCTKRYKKL